MQKIIAFFKKIPRALRLGTAASFMGFAFYMAFRLLRGGHSKRGIISLTSWFSMLGIMLGVGALIVVMSIMNGFRIELIDRILGISSHVQIYEKHGDLLDNTAGNAFTALPGIISVSAVNESQAVLIRDQTASALLIRSLSGQDIVKRSVFRDSLTPDSLPWRSFDRGDGVVIGAGLANAYNIEIGDKITLVPPYLTESKVGLLPNPKEYKVIGIFHIGMNDYDRNIVFMPPKIASGFMRQGDGQVQKLEIMIQKPGESKEFLKMLKPKLADNEVALDWQSNNAQLVSSLKVESNVMFLILTMIIMVAAFNVVSGQSMLVKEKKSTIAIVRATGGSRWLVMTIFLIAGSSLGIIGTCLGTLFGVLIASHAEAIRQFIQKLSGTPIFSPEVYYLTQLPSKIIVSDVILINCLALMISILAALWPAINASRLPPADILRHE
ncbi:MAG: ABC transporter permease [Hydrotalea sp.]|nr:ABC transporter permease [Hydrotalea sp.]